MDEYTPTTEEILRYFNAPAYRINPQREGEGFAEYLERASIAGLHAQMNSEKAARRWLAAHDRVVAANAWEEGARFVLDVRWVDGDEAPPNPYRITEENH